MKEEALRKKLEDLALRESVPESTELSSSLEKGTSAMTELPAKIRPASRSLEPGGLIQLNNTVPSLIIPDLHGRRPFLLKLMNAPVHRGKTFLQLLSEGKVNVICVGDAFHGEAPVKSRWEEAFREFGNDYSASPAMDMEMADNLNLLIMLLELKSARPENFFFLKGNHENILNVRGEGNYPFRKFAAEGAMVRRWIEKFRGEKCLDDIHRYERTLPLAAAGDGFLITHAEPAETYTVDQIINAYSSEDVVYGLTWTDNGQAEEGSVTGTLKNFFPGRDRTVCIGGHRPTSGLFAVRNGGSYIQINSPTDYIAAVVWKGEEFNPERYIFHVDDLYGQY